MATTSSVFNICFNNSFQKYGFIKIKGTNIFARLINDEIFQYITYKHQPYQIKGYKEFSVYAGILTIFSESLDKEYLLQWGEYVDVYATHFFPEKVENKLSYSYNEENMIQIISSCLEKAEKIVMPVMESVTDLEKYIEFRKKNHINILFGAKRLKNDSILLVKTDNHDDFMGVFNEALQSEMELVEKGMAGGTYEEHYELLYDGLINNIAGSRDEVYNDLNLYESVNKELERRKQENLRLLANYGFIV